MIENKENGHRITIAYAEDEGWFRKPTVEMLIENGFNVIAAHNDRDKLLDFLENSLAGFIFD